MFKKADTLTRKGILQELGLDAGLQEEYAKNSARQMSVRSTEEVMEERVEEMIGRDMD